MHCLVVSTPGDNTLGMVVMPTQDKNCNSPDLAIMGRPGLIHFSIFIYSPGLPIMSSVEMEYSCGDLAEAWLKQKPVHKALNGQLNFLPTLEMVSIPHLHMWDPALVVWT